MNTLSDKFNRPRLVTTSLVDKLLQSSAMTQESLNDLNTFVGTFSESISLLDALKIPDTGSFILFSIAFRCLPVSTRKLFEANSSVDYPTIGQLLDFLWSWVAILEVVGESHKNSASNASSKSTGQFRKGGDYAGKPRFTSLVTSKSNSTCPCCAGSHALTACARFKNWDPDKRARWTCDKKLCFNCFSDEHWALKCNAKSSCKNCTRKHHSLLHHMSSSRDRDIRNEPPAAKASLCASVPRPLPHQASSIILGIALVHMRDRSGSWQTMRALIDCASQISAVTSACADQLGLKRSRWRAPISGLSRVPAVNVQGRVECSVQPRFASEHVLSINAWVLPAITSDLPRTTLHPNIKDRYSNLALADPSFDITSPVDVLLGGDVYASIMDGRKISVDKALPTMFSSVFGWILIGPVFDRETHPYQSVPVAMTVSIEELMERFWQVEEPEAAPATFTDEGRCEKLFCEQSMRLPCSRFSVPLPFRAPPSAWSWS